MTDEEYLFRQTERDRKRVGRGALHKKGGSKSKKCSLPSDNLTAKELKKMSGPVVSYKMNAPVKWAEFKQWPDEIQRDYISLLIGKYSVGTPELAKMFGVKDDTVAILRRALGIGAKRGGKRPPVSPEWKVFLGEAETPSEKGAEKCEEPTEKGAEKCENDDEILRLAALLSALKGTGAKLTIEVVL